MTKNDFVLNIVDNIGYSKIESQKIVDSFFETIKVGLIEEKNVKISGFGVFEVVHKRERIGRNPKTKVETIITARNVVRFRPSTILKETVNS